ncbi:MAG: tRNA modification GTPase MnmE [Bacteriovoracaceae bacterium]|nr:tRNA modification GTPase MnmE [Bacteriovoracaceae bacterium]
MVDTICALSTPWGRSALGLIRISGPNSIRVVETMGAINLIPRSPAVVVLRDQSDKPIDECLVTFFKAPNSYTGEDLIEIGAHGNPLILQKLVDEFVSRETIRLAEPGEFTSRALANGKMSLDQVESLDWILNSASLEGIRRGLSTKLLGLSSTTAEVSGQFLELLTLVQSQLDFSEEETGSIDRKNIETRVEVLLEGLKKWAESFDINKHLLENWVVALVGPPNSGKSSLFNKLIGQKKAIEFDQPGTTRDSIEHIIEMDGVGIVLIDTAGIRISNDPIEKIGIEKTHEAIKRADVVCWVDDEAGQLPPADLLIQNGNKKWLNILSKADLDRKLEKKGSEQFISVSSRSEFGIEKLRKALLPERDVSIHESSGWVPLTSKRQRALVGFAGEQLAASIEDLRSGQYLDMTAERLLSASRAIQGIVEPPKNDDVLKEIFSRFCIGK